ncbi:MAG: GntR family transcriptional regulator [Lachnospiraceae bacterium]|nr:GntR family transcriptional regulator [Lachnospiraceae bacterium]
MSAKRTVKTIREQVYRILRDEICQGVYPAGYWLQEAELTEHLQVSRSPVREAMRQLVSDGLLIEIPNKGVFVKKFTIKDIEEIYDLRVLLESYAIYHSAGHMTTSRTEKLLSLLEAFETTYKTGDREAYTAVDEDLHTSIVRFTDNSLVNDIYERVHSMNQQFRVMSLMDERRFRESLDEHRAIIHALVTGDVHTADAIDRHHLMLACEAIRKQLENQKEPEKEAAAQVPSKTPENGAAER